MCNSQFRTMFSSLHCLFQSSPAKLSRTSLNFTNSRTFIKMLGKIALEEAYEMTGMEAKSEREAALYIAKDDRTRYMRQISDINNERVKLADDHGIGYT